MHMCKYFSIFSLFLFIISSLLSISAKKSNKLKNMLNKQASEKSDLENLRNKQNAKKVSADDMYGLQIGSINYKNFEYKNQHSFMTSDEAIVKCETDVACGGFTFHGIDVPNRKHYIFFVHFIPFGGIMKSAESSLLWNTYRSTKKVIQLSGKVEV